MFKCRGVDNGLKGDLNGNKERIGLFSRGSSPYRDRVYKSQQNLSNPDYTNGNALRPSTSIYIPSSFDVKLNSRLSPINTKNYLRSFDTDITTDKDGRENSEKMLESRMNTSILDVYRAPADGSSRQNSFCLPSDDVSTETDSANYGYNSSNEIIQDLTSRYKDLETSKRIDEVNSERLEEHVKVLNRNIKSLENKLEQTEAQLKKERIKAAKLEKSLEKAQIDIKCIITPNHSTYGKVDLDYTSNKILRKSNYNSSESNQESIILGTFENSSDRGRLTSAKGSVRKTPTKKKLERQSSLKHFTEKGPTIYL